MNALFDLQGAIIEKSLGALLGGRVRDAVSIAGVVGIATVSDMVEQAERFVAAGIRTVKVKIGRDVDQDIRAVRAVRDAVGERVEIRVDANGGYSFGEAVRFGHGVDASRVQYLEQPLPRGDTRGLARLRQRMSTPIAVDESLHGIQDALEVCRLDAADVFVIKLIKCGGLHQARKIVAIAEAAGTACVTVSPYETPIGVACNVHLAASSTAFRFASELGPGVSDVDFDGADELEYVNGEVIVPGANGVGVRPPEWVFDESATS